MDYSLDQKSADELRETVKEDFSKLTVRLADELDRMIKIYVFAREALETELYSGMGYKRLGIQQKDLVKLKDLTTGMASLVQAKIKFDAASKKLAANMTPKEEMAAVITYVMALSGDAQNELRSRLAERGIWKWKT